MRLGHVPQVQQPPKEVEQEGLQTFIPNRRQGIATYNIFVQGLPEQTLEILQLPSKLSINIEASGVSNLQEKKRQRHVAQFLRDLADSFDPDGTWSSRHQPDKFYKDLAEICAVHGVGMNLVTALVEAHVEGKGKPE